MKNALMFRPSRTEAMPPADGGLACRLLAKGVRSGMLLAGAALLCAGGAGTVSAQMPDHRQAPVLGKPAKPLPPNRCARYGEGYVAVEGSDACVRIGGRLRIDIGGSARSGVAPMSGYSFGDNLPGESDGLSRAHIRLPSSRQDGDPITR
ncbi:MAG: porin [Beijerinckiaceae bacterium]|nr:porin [Beijerinckiaceae bacterium]